MFQDEFLLNYNCLNVEPWTVCYFMLEFNCAIGIIESLLIHMPLPLKLDGLSSRKSEGLYSFCCWMQDQFQLRRYHFGNLGHGWIRYWDPHPYESCGTYTLDWSGMNQKIFLTFTSTSFLTITNMLIQSEKGSYDITVCCGFNNQSLKLADHERLYRNNYKWRLKEILDEFKKTVELHCIHSQ